MIYQNFYDNPNMLINAIGNYIPYIIKVKLYNQKESNWLQNKPYYSIIFNEYFVVNNQRFLIKDIEIGYGKSEWGAPKKEEVIILKLERRLN